MAFEPQMDEERRAHLDHLVLVEDADRLTEILPQLNVLEKRLQERGVAIEYQFPENSMAWVYGKVTLANGHVAEGVQIKFTWDRVKERGKFREHTVLVCRVEGRRVRTARYEKSCVTNNFNYDKLVDAIVIAAEKDEYITTTERQLEANQPDADRLEKLVNDLGMPTHNLRVGPDHSRPGVVALRIDISRRLDAKAAQVVIEKMAEAGIFDLMDAD